MNALKYILTFIAGAGVGAFVTYEILVHKNEEVLEVIEYNPEERGDDREAKTIKDKPNIMDYYKNKQKETVSNNNYISPATETPIVSEPDPKEIIPLDEPYSISAEEFGEIDGYEKETYWLFADDVLTDHNQNILSKEDVSKTVGPNYISCIGEYADECGYIRNDKAKTDYEILTDHRKYHEALRES